MAKKCYHRYKEVFHGRLCTFCGNLIRRRKKVKRSKKDTTVQTSLGVFEVKYDED